jgi:hypothetical protein
MKKLIVIFLLSSSISAVADCGTIIMPPKEIQTSPLSFNPYYHFMNYFELDGWCKSLGAIPTRAGRIEACTKGRNIYLPREGTGGVDHEKQVCLATHEIAHVKHWPGDHPNGHYE